MLAQQLNRSQRRSEKKHEKAKPTHRDKKSMTLEARISFFASPRQAIASIEGSGRAKAIDIECLIGIGKVAEFIAGRNGIEFSKDPIKALCDAVETGVVDEETIDGAKAVLDRVYALSGTLPRGEWIDAITKTQVWTALAEDINA